jgi:NADH-quinone oxidoreductase subunit J
MFAQIAFYVLAAILVGAAVMVITARNPVHAALFLVLAFFTSAGVWLLLEAEFLAIILVLVYVGAVMVLFLFVVMMLDINLVPLREGFIRYLPVGIGIAVVVLVELVLVLGGDRLDMLPVPEPHPADYSNTRELGLVLYTVYVYPFEIASIILLVAIVAAIALTLRRREGRRGQRPEEQVRVRRADRVRLVKMPAVRREPLAEGGSGRAAPGEPPPEGGE